MQLTAQPGCIAASCQTKDIHRFTSDAQNKDEADRWQRKAIEASDSKGVATVTPKVLYEKGAQYPSQAASDVSVDSTASTMADAEMP